MVEILTYTNPERTIQIMRKEEKEKDMFGYKLPKQTIEVVIDNEVIRLNLVDVKHIPT